MVVWLFHAVLWVCMRLVTVVFTDHTHLLFLTLEVKDENNILIDTHGLPIKVSKGAKIRNRYNQVPHLT